MEQQVSTTGIRIKSEPIDNGYDQPPDSFLNIKLEPYDDGFEIQNYQEAQNYQETNQEFHLEFNPELRKLLSNPLSVLTKFSDDSLSWADNVYPRTVRLTAWEAQIQSSKISQPVDSTSTDNLLWNAMISPRKRGAENVPPDSCTHDESPPKIAKTKDSALMALLALPLRSEENGASSTQLCSSSEQCSSSQLESTRNHSLTSQFNLTRHHSSQPTSTSELGRDSYRGSSKSSILSSLLPSSTVSSSENGRGQLEKLLGVSLQKTGVENSDSARDSVKSTQVNQVQSSLTSENSREPTAENSTIRTLLAQPLPVQNKKTYKPVLLNLLTEPMRKPNKQGKSKTSSGTLRQLLSAPLTKLQESSNRNDISYMTDFGASFYQDTFEESNDSIDLETFPCDECNKCFTNEQDLLDHAQSHVDPFMCGECGDEFGKKKALLLHKRRHHKIPKINSVVPDRNDANSLVETEDLDNFENKKWDIPGEVDFIVERNEDYDSDS